MTSNSSLVTFNSLINPDYQLYPPDTSRDNLQSEIDKYRLALDLKNHIPNGISESVKNNLGIDRLLEHDISENIDFSDTASIPITSQYNINTTSFILVIPASMFLKNISQPGQPASYDCYNRYRNFFGRLREMSIDCEFPDFSYKHVNSCVVVMLRGDINRLFGRYKKREYVSNFVKSTITSDSGNNLNDLEYKDGFFNMDPFFFKKYIDFQSNPNTNIHDYLFSIDFWFPKSGDILNQTRHNIHKILVETFIDNYNFFIDNRKDFDILFDPIRSVVSGIFTEGINYLQIYNVCSSLSSRRKKYISRTLKFMIETYRGDLYLCVDTENPYFLYVCKLYTSLGFTKPHCFDTHIGGEVHTSKLIHMTRKGGYIRSTSGLIQNQNFVTFSNIPIPTEEESRKRDMIKIYNIMNSLNGFTKLYNCVYNFCIPRHRLKSIYETFINDNTLDKEFSGMFYVTEILNNKTLMLDYDENDLVAGGLSSVNTSRFFARDIDERVKYQDIVKLRMDDLDNREYEYSTRSKARNSPYINFHCHYKKLRYLYYKDTSYRLMIPSNQDLILVCYSFINTNLLCHIVFTDTYAIKLSLNNIALNFIRHVMLLTTDKNVVFKLIDDFFKDIYGLVVVSIPGIYVNNIKNVNDPIKRVNDPYENKVHADNYKKIMDEKFTLGLFFSYLQDRYNETRTGIHSLIKEPLRPKLEPEYADIVFNHTNTDLISNKRWFDIEMIQYIDRTGSFNDMYFSKTDISIYDCSIYMGNMLRQGQNRERFNYRIKSEILEKFPLISSQDELNLSIVKEEFRNPRGV